MKVIAYSIQPSEKKPLITFNNKKHEITFISNRVDLETADYAKGKEAALVFSTDEISAAFHRAVHARGIKYICTRNTDHIDLEEASRLGIEISDLPPYLPAFSPGIVSDDFSQVILNHHQAIYSREALAAIAEKTIDNLDQWVKHSSEGRDINVNPCEL